MLDMAVIKKGRQKNRFIANRFFCRLLFGCCQHGRVRPPNKTAKWTRSEYVYIICQSWRKSNSIYIKNC